MGGPVITAVLLLSVITITRGQYFDVLQGLQQLFQPQPSTDFTNQYNGFPNPQTTHKPDRRKQTDRQEDRRTKKPPINQYEYIFSTTQKTTKKSKNNSSQSSRSLTNKNQYSNILLGDFFNPFDVTTKASRYKTTTTKVNPNNNFYNNDDYNRGTTENVFANNFDINRPVTENIFENINRGDSYAGLNQPGHVYENENTRRPGNNVYESNVAGGNNDRGYSQNNNQNIGSNNPNRGVLNTDFSYDIPVTTNNRNPGVDRPINRVNPNNGYLNTDLNPDDYVQPQINPYVPKPNNRVQNQYENNYSNVGNNFNNGAINSNNNNRVNYNNQGNYDPDRITFEYPSDTPLINRPGVQPAPVDTGLPPITNRPVADRNDYDNRPSDTSGVNYDDQSGGEPEILIGPDEDDMSERQKRNYAQLAEKMCDRYKALTVKKVVALPLVPSPDPVTLNVSDCTPINVPLVIGGTVVSIREFPHMALVGWMKTRQAGYSWKCGGSLISNRYILTAGHCTYQDKDYDVVSGPPQAVQLGSSYLDDPGALVVKVAAVIRHPKYKQRRSYHDVALIRMANTVTFSEVIRPACLGAPPPEGNRLIATGWGRTEFGGDHSVELRSVSLSVWNMADCRDIWGTSLKLPNGVTPDSHLCAGEKTGGKDTCQGDSGGPAQVQDGCVWRVVGVTSLGRACGAPSTPALYAVVPRAFIAAAAFSQ